MLSLQFDPFPELLTERLLLRQVKPYDEEDLFFLRSDERTMKYIDRPRATSAEEIKPFIEKINTSLLNRDGITWAIAAQRSFKMIGTIGFWRIAKEHCRAELGYTLHPDFHGKGMMQEALAKVIDYGFHAMKLHSIEANVNPANKASIRLLEKNNFLREAHFRENYYFEGKFLDSVIYSLVNSKK
jgi:ribosomal-protein-alanine N-acetyltransferase